MSIESKSANVKEINFGRTAKGREIIYTAYEVKEYHKGTRKGIRVVPGRADSDLDGQLWTWDERFKDPSPYKGNTIAIDVRIIKKCFIELGLTIKIHNLDIKTETVKPQRERKENINMSKELEALREQNRLQQEQMRLQQEQINNALRLISMTAGSVQALAEASIKPTVAPTPIVQTPVEESIIEKREEVEEDFINFDEVVATEIDQIENIEIEEDVVEIKEEVQEELIVEDPTEKVAVISEVKKVKKIKKRVSREE